MHGTVLFSFFHAKTLDMSGRICYIDTTSLEGCFFVCKILALQQPFSIEREATLIMEVPL